MSPSKSISNKKNWDRGGEGLPPLWAPSWATDQGLKSYFFGKDLKL